MSSVDLARDQGRIDGLAKDSTGLGLNTDYNLCDSPRPYRDSHYSARMSILDYDSEEELARESFKKTNGEAWPGLKNFVNLCIGQLYLHLLLRIPLVYLVRASEIFEDSDIKLEDIKEMALETAFYNKGYRYLHDEYGQASAIPPPYKQLEASWNAFVDSLLRDWNTYNIVSALLISAILTILQIDSAASDPLIRYSLIAAQICALMSLLFGCVFSVRFDSSMRKTYKAAEWAIESKKVDHNIWWNIWILLAMPAVWLTWTIIFYFIGIMGFLWRTRTQDTPPPPALSPHAELIVQILISSLFGLGCLTAGLSLMTFRHYGIRMDRAWARRIKIWAERKQSAAETAQYDSVNISPPHILARGFNTSPPMWKTSYGSPRIPAKMAYRAHKWPESQGSNMPPSAFSTGSSTLPVSPPPAFLSEGLDSIKERTLDRLNDGCASSPSQKNSGVPIPTRRTTVQ